MISGESSTGNDISMLCYIGHGFIVHSLSTANCGASAVATINSECIQAGDEIVTHFKITLTYLYEITLIFNYNNINLAPIKPA